MRRAAVVVPVVLTFLTNLAAAEPGGPPAPALLTPADGSFTNDDTPVYSGTAEPGASVTFIVDGVPLGAATADASGNVTLTPVVPLADGVHAVRATATDAGGNTSESSSTHTFTVDTVLPEEPELLTPINHVITNDDTPTYSGTAEPGTTAYFVVQGITVGVTAVAANGSVSVTQPTPLPDGDYFALFTVRDAAGNARNSNLRYFTVDTTAPAAPVVASPAEGETISEDSTTITATAEAGSTVAIFLDGVSAGTTQADASGNVSLVAPALTEGLHILRLRATDPAGNASPESATRAFYVDTLAPAAPVVTSPVNGSTISSVTPTIEGTAEALATVEVFVDGATIGTTIAAGGSFALAVPSPLDAGDHTVIAIATDAAGHVSGSSTTVTFTARSGAGRGGARCRSRTGRRQSRRRRRWSRGRRSRRIARRDAER